MAAGQESDQSAPQQELGSNNIQQVSYQQAEPRADQSTEYTEPETDYLSPENDHVRTLIRERSARDTSARP